LSIFRDRTTTDEREQTHADVVETRAEAADVEAREAERIEADERRRLVVAEPVHPITAARERFGGVDFPASLVGMLTALATVVLLGGLVGAVIGAIGYQTGVSGDNVEDISIASLIAGLAVLFVAYLVGGWTAGRIARYDGARNGLMTAVWTIVLAAVLSALAAFFGSEYDVLANVDLPQWFDRDAVTTAAIISGVVAIAAMLVGGLLGGLWGTRYHRLADETLLDAHDTGPRYP
jgi:ABC-type transport system involved in cytochrome c biogenesis permease subunit